MTTTINADTVVGGAIVTGDASGELALQAAGVTKLTVNSSGVTLATPLPVASGGTGGSATATAGGIAYGTGTAQAYTSAGTSGQYLTSAGAGTPTWATLSVPGAGVTVYNNVTTATTYTLTSASNATIEIDSQAYGIKVVLPNATTMTARSNAFIIRNVGEYPILIEDSANIAIGGVPASLQVSCNLNSVATAAGTWILDQNACYAVETSLVQLGITNVFATKRLSSTKFYAVGNADGVDLTIQGFTVSGDTITAGTPTTLVALGGATLVETVAIDSSRALVTYYDGGSVFISVVVDLTNINSLVVGSPVTISSFLGSNFRFDQKPLNSYEYTESLFKVSGRLTGTNIFCYYYRITSTTGYTELNSIDVGASGTTITLHTAVQFPYGSTTTMINLGAIVISSSSVGLATIFNATGVGSVYGMTASLSGTTWSANALNYASGGSFSNSTGMVWSNRAIIVGLRTFVNGIVAFEYPASGNAAPTTLNASYGTYTANAALLKTSAGILVTNAGSSGLTWFSYTFGSALTYVNENSLSTAGTTASTVGFIDTDTCQTLTLSTTSVNVLVYLNTSTNTIDFRWLGQDSATRTVGTLYGFPGASTNFAMVFNNTATTVLNSYMKFMRVTTDTTPKITPTKNFGWNKIGSYTQTFGAKYFSLLGKYLFVFNTRNMITVPMSASGTNGLLGETGYKDYQSENYINGIQNCDLDSSRLVWYQTLAQPDIGLASLTTSQANVFRFSLLRIANT